MIKACWSKDSKANVKRELPTATKKSLKFQMSHVLITFQVRFIETKNQTEGHKIFKIYFITEIKKQTN